MSRVDELERRIEQLEHGQGRLERGVVDDEGRRWTMADFLNMGLTRRQAMGAIAAIAGGASLATALSQQVRAQPTGDEGQVGQSGNRVEVWASEIDATEIATDELTTAGITAELTHDLPNSPPTDSVSVTLDTSTYEVFFIRLETAGVSGNSTVDLTAGSAADGDYAYVTRSGTTLNSQSSQNDLPLADTTRTGVYTADMWLEGNSRPILIDGSYSEITADRTHVIEGGISQAMSGDEGFTFNVADSTNRIQRVQIVSGVRA